ncbi:hypothetical protein N0V93_007066 [Gnomoniopsis smithogilvyi]|uniref:Uncharacterized protein n=1 Tax=Gnomoniopsis smithogilvyi TaxID=1191159 RepID=A0A9W8YT34_9PEZI|nr:hypothetical protein N0V93_007066 [Gnomoniopsis smithogilvyi]
MSEATKMTYEEFFKTISNIPGGTIFMAMPYDADLSNLRFVAAILLPAGREVIVDEEVVFLYARLEDFNDDVWGMMSEEQQHVLARAITRYHNALRGFLTMYNCPFYRRWESAKGRAGEDNCGQYGQEQGDGKILAE